VVARRGATKLGCLVQLLVLAAVVHFGWPIAQVYLRHERFKDAVEQIVRMHAQKPIPEIRQRIQATADSLEMPEDAGIAMVKKQSGKTIVESHYDVTFILPGTTRDKHFEVKVQASY
jgi:hypothetical protein